MNHWDYLGNVVVYLTDDDLAARGLHFTAPNISGYTGAGGPGPMANTDGFTSLTTSMQVSGAATHMSNPGPRGAVVIVHESDGSTTSYIVSGAALNQPLTTSLNPANQVTTQFTAGSASSFLKVFAPDKVATAATVAAQDRSTLFGWLDQTLFGVSDKQKAYFGQVADAQNIAAAGTIMLQSENPTLAAELTHLGVIQQSMSIQTSISLAALFSVPEAPTATPPGIVYFRADASGGLRPYVGQAESESLYLNRQVAHARNNPDADFSFQILGRAEPGLQLDVLEEDWIRRLGGPTNKSNPDGGLSNKRVQMSDPRYQAAGGNVPINNN